MKSFRLAQGWKKEVEEVSLGALVAILIVVAVGVKTTFAFSYGIFFSGQVVTIAAVCTAGPTNPCNAFNGLTAPFIVFASNEAPPFIAINPAAAICVPKPAKGAYILGIGIQQAQVFVAGMYCLHS